MNGIEICKPPTKPNFKDTAPRIFLAGSIEMGAAVNWQDRVVNNLISANEKYPLPYEVRIFNPRRDDWDNSWEQKIENKQFREQVEWELDALENCSLVAMYFDPATKSPISLLEFGLFARLSHPQLVVCCPEGFWRKGNIDIVCNKFEVAQVPTLDELIKVCVRHATNYP